MKATEARLLTFLHRSAQFLIPIYQRTYNWPAKQCEQLWEDILRAGQDDAVDGHFIGSMVYVERGLYSHSAIPQLLVIDGQQRLTTVSLIITALSRAIGEKPAIEGMSARKLANYYLLNAEEDGDLRFKLLLTRSDRETLQKLIEGKTLPETASERVEQNYRLFEDKLRRSGDDVHTAVYRGLSKLIIVDIALDRDRDNPQLIFESLNSTGLDLSQADLIRNYVLMGLEPKVQQTLYEEHWFPMEQGFGQQYTQQFDRFMRDYLTVKTGTIPRTQEVYEAFKKFTRTRATPIGEIIADVHRYAEYFTAFALERERDKDLLRAFQDLNELKVDVAYPLLLEMYHDYREGALERDELLQSVRLVESYVFRRAVCEIPTNSLNKTFATLSRELKKDRYLESLKAALLRLSSYRRYPDDEEFKRGLMVRDLYNTRSRNYWLRRLENHQRKERVNVEEYTIEHIMPQNENLSAAWRAELGENWKSVHATYLHTLGNLTLTGYNPELSDRSFAEKRDMDGGFRDSPLRLNKGLGQVDRWGEAAIRQRAEQLAALAAEVWPAPVLPQEVMDQYRRAVEKSTYALDDHQYLAGGPVRELFDHFRNQVLSLDPAVREVILKLYIAYKLDTNFVDVVPQAGRLRLSLNMRFDEVDDPQGLCKDVTGMGRWGNGDVEVGLSSMDQLPYVMALVRQAFEKQLEGEA